jgi:hypothetical protein
MVVVVVPGRATTKVTLSPPGEPDAGSSEWVEAGGHGIRVYSLFFSVSSFHPLSAIRCPQSDAVRYPILKQTVYPLSAGRRQKRRRYPLILRT